MVQLLYHTKKVSVIKWHNDPANKAKVNKLMAAYQAKNSPTMRKSVIQKMVRSNIIKAEDTENYSMKMSWMNA